MNPIFCCPINPTNQEQMVGQYVKNIGQFPSRNNAFPWQRSINPVISKSDAVGRQKIGVFDKIISQRVVGGAKVPPRQERQIKKNKKKITRALKKHRIFQDSPSDGLNNCGFNAILPQIPKKKRRKYNVAKLREIAGAPGTTWMSINDHCPKLTKALKMPILVIPFEEELPKCAFLHFSIGENNYYLDLNFEPNIRLSTWVQDTILRKKILKMAGINGKKTKNKIKNKKVRKMVKKELDIEMADLFAYLIASKNTIVMKHVPGHFQRFLHKKVK